MLKLNFDRTQNSQDVFAFLWLPIIVFLKIIGPSIVAVLIIVCGQISAEAQKATVFRVSATTSDGIQFQVFAPKIAVKGKDILFDYVILNEGKKNVYLVINPLYTDVKITENRIFDFVQPVVGPDDHQRFNYQFIRIRPKGKFRGKIVLSRNVISSIGLQNLSRTTTRVSFSYLFDISDFGNCQQSTYRLACLQELYERSKSLTIGNLVVDVETR